jgi:5'-3' exonuclease
MRKLILIDVAGIFRANWASMGDLEVSEALHRTVERVHSLSAGYDLCAVCCDWPPYRRAKLYDQYKIHRTTPTQVMVEQFRRTKERLAADGYLLWQVDGFEADDVIATAVQYAKREGLEVTIASSDKDLLCLVDDEAKVSQLVLSTGEVYRELEVNQRFGVAPRLMPDLLALMGDKSDNIPGIQGVGVKKAADLLREFGNAEDVFACAKTIPGKLGEWVRAHGIERLRLAMSLVKLETDVPIDWDAIYAERKPLPLTEEEDDMSEVDDFDTDHSESEEAIRKETERISAERRDDEPPARPTPLPPPPREPKSEPRAIERAEPEVAQVQAITRVPVEYNQQLEPMNIDQAFRLARGLANSRLYGKFPNAEAIMAVIIRGREMGLGALTALDSMHVIEGRPSPSAHLIIARAKAHPDCEYLQCLETTPTRSVWETKNRRNPKPTKLEYTIEQAAQAGLTSRGGNWKARPAEMLRKSCGVQLARLEYPDAALGLVCPEEMGIDAA